MCSCRWAHTRWAVTHAQAKILSPQAGVFTPESSGIHLRAVSFRGPLACLKHIWCIFRSSYRSRNGFFFQADHFFLAAACTFPVLFPQARSLACAHSLTHTQAKDPCGFTYVMLDLHQLIFTRKHKQIAASVSAACPESKHLVLAPSVCSNNWGTCFYEAKKTLLDSNVGNRWEENVPNSSPRPPSS